MSLLVGHNKALPALKAHLIIFCIELICLVLPLPVNVNVVVTAALTVYAGCWRSLKEAPPTESMTKHDAMRFPLVGKCITSVQLWTRVGYEMHDSARMLLRA